MDSTRTRWGARKRGGSIGLQQSAALASELSFAERLKPEGTADRSSRPRLTSRRSPVRARHRPSARPPRTAPHSPANRIDKGRLRGHAGPCAGECDADRDAEWRVRHGRSTIRPRATASGGELRRRRLHGQRLILAVAGASGTAVAVPATPSKIASRPSPVSGRASGPGHTLRYASSGLGEPAPRSNTGGKRWRSASSTT